MTKTTQSQNVTTQNTTLANCLVFNNRFATQKLTADQLGAENFAIWKNLVETLHNVAYSIYAHCENNGLKVENSQVDKSPIYDIVKIINKAIGEVNGMKLFANEETAIAMVSYAGKRANLDAPQLKLVLTQISNAKRELTQAQETNGISQDRIAELQERIDTLTAQKDELLATADMRIKKPTKTSDAAFRLDVEHYFARTIVGQQAKSVEEIEAEKQERKEKSKAKAKARREAKKQAK